MFVFPIVEGRLQSRIPYPCRRCFTKRESRASEVKLESDQVHRGLPHGKQRHEPRARNGERLGQAQRLPFWGV